MRKKEGRRKRGSKSRAGVIYSENSSVKKDKYREK